MVYKKGRSGDRFRKVKINNNNKKYNKKEYTKIAFLGIFLLAIVCGTSYAFLSQVITSKKNVEVTAGTFVINFKEKNTIDLKNAVPMTDQEGMNTESYVFSVNNTGSLDAKYDISLEENSNNTLDRKYVKYSIKEVDGEWSSPALLSTGLNLKTGRSLGSGATDSYEIKIWLDETATNEVQGKTYGAKVVINAVQTNSTVTDFTTPIILLNGPSTVKLNQGDTFNDLGVQEVKDDKDKLLVDDVEISYEYYDGENTVEVSSIDTSKVGIYYIYYKISDSSGNVGVSTRTVLVSKKNTGLPTISLVGDEVVTIKEGDSYTESGAIANDSEDGSLTDKIVVIGSVNTKVAGTYVIKYLVEDRDSNIASITRTVIVEPSNGSIKVDISYDTSNIAETLVSISSVSNASNVKYAITNDDKKPSDKEFKDLTDENGKFIGTVSFKKNGKYYLWIKDSYGNIVKKIVVIDKLDETKPTCIFKTTGYVGIGSDSKISLICTDVVDIKEKYLLKSDFKISNEDVIDSFDISAPTKVDNGYEWNLTISAKKLGSFKLSLLKDVISDRVDNKNDEVTSNDIKVSELVLDSDSSVSLDISGNNTHTIKTSGTNVGSLSYSSSDDSVAKVSSTGVITGVSPGEAKIIVKENNGGAYRTIKVDVSKTLTATFVKNGVGVEKISSSKETCKLTKDNKETCNITSIPTISVSNGYQAIGWNTDKTAHDGYMDISLSKDTTFYSISKKADSVLTAIFDSNNGSAILSKEGSVSCSIPGVYNDEEQATSCSIDVPTITGKNPTPIVLGFSTSSSSKKAEISSGSKLTLTDKNANTTWYAITTNEDITYTAKFIKNDGNGVINNAWSNKTCTIEKTYNGLVQATSCTIDEIPTIEVSSGYQAIGWNTDKTAHVGLESLALSNDTNFYTIVKKLPVTYTATLHKSGNGVTAIGANSISCTTKESYNGEKEDNSCVPSQKLPSITVNSGYKALGWSQNSSAKEKASDTMATDGYIEVGESITLANNIDLYSISKKEDITYSVTFDSNGATLSKEGVLSCTIDGSYNNDTQVDSCSVDVPTIIREGFDIIGFSTDSNNTDTDSSTHIKAGSSLKLSSSNDKKTYYANTKKDVTVTWNANGATLNTLTTSKTIWNKNSSVVITAPEITRDGYEIIGWSKDPNGDENSKDLVKVGSDITISSNDSYYAITKKIASATFYYYNGTKQVSDTASCTMYNTSNVCNINIPNSVVNSTGPNGTLYRGVSNKVSNTELISEINSNTLSYYAVYDNNINVNFYYYGGSEQLFVTGNGVRGAVSDGTNYKVSDATINVPSEVSESKGIDSSIYQGLSTSPNSINKTSSITTANSDYYAYYKGTWKVSYSKGENITSISKTVDSCDYYSVTNKTNYLVNSTDSCKVKLPTIEPNTGYKADGWFDGDDNVGISGGDYTISSNKLLASRASIGFYTVIYDYAINGGSGSSEKTLEASYGSNADLTVTASKNGYEFVGWNTDKDATSGLTTGPKVTNDITLYAIFKKTNTANFYYYSNGATTSAKATCTVYNNQESCNYTLPSGVSGSSGPDGTTYKGVSNKVSSTTLTTTYPSTSANYYAVYEGSKSATIYYYNGSGIVSDTSASGKTTGLCDGTSYKVTYGSVTVPSTVSGSSGQYGTSYVGVSDAVNKMSTTSSLTANKTYYAVYRGEVTQYYYNGTQGSSRKIYRNNYFTSNSNLATVLSDSTTGVNNLTLGAGYNTSTALGLTTSATSTSAQSVANSAKTNTTTFYTIYQKSIGATFYYYNSSTSAVTSATAAGNRIYNYGTDILSEGTITVPSAVSGSSGMYSSTYKGVSAQASSTTAATVSTKNTTYYAYYLGSWKAKFNNQNSSVSTIGSTSSSCDSYKTTDGKTYSSASCQITLPSITTTSTEYTIGGWNTNKSATSGTAAAQKVTISDATVNDSSDSLTTNFYTIIGKKAITRTAIFNKNGATSQTDSSNQASTATTVTRSCTIGAISNIASQTQATTCNVTTPTIVASSNTPTVLGYNTTSSATIATVNQNTAISINSNPTYYAITKKDAVTFTANWNANGATLSSTAQSSCNIAATYNGAAQATSCTVTAPTITAPSATPTVLGYNTSASSNSNNSSYNTTSKLLTLNSSNTGSTWYAQTRKDAVSYTVSSYEKGSNVSSIGAKTDANSKCTINATYNGTAQATSCTVTAPSITANTGYTSVGWSLTSGATTGSSVITLNGSNTGKAWYANATANSYTINYYDGTTIKGSSSAKVDTYPTLTKASSLSLSKTGYTFKGWATTNGGAVVYTDGQKLTANLATTAGAKVNLYAVWKDETVPVCSFSGASATTTQNTTSITLSCTDSGSGVVQKTLATTDFTTTANGSVTAVGSPVKITNGYSYTVTLKGLSVGTFTVSLKAGLISDVAGNSNAVATSGNVTVNGRTYTVTFSKGSNVSAISSTSSSCTTTGSSLTCTIGTYPTITAATGYSASTWYDSTAKKDTGIASGGSGSGYAISQNTTMTAQAKANTYTISYNANGGSGTMASTTATYGSTTTISANTFTKTGYSFAGWTTNSDGTDDGYGWTNWSGTWKYVNGQYGISGGKLVLYARWSANNYTIKYDANGGTGAPANQSFVYNSGAKISTTKPTRTGYTFVNWKSGSTTLNPGDAIPTGWTNATLQAQWTVNSYTMTYDYNYLDNDIFDTTYNTNSYNACCGSGSLTSKSESFDANGRTFSVTSTEQSWYFASTNALTNGKTYTWQLEAKASTSANLTVGSEQGGYGSYSIGTDWKKLSKTFTASSTGNKAFIFYGWYGSGSRTLSIRNVQLHEGGLNTTTSKKNYGTTLSDLPTPVARTGYTFKGWFTQPVGGTQVSTSTSVPASDSTYYAQWTLNSHTVTYDKNGGDSVSKASATSYYGSKIDLTPTASKSGYEFIGWNTNKNATTALSSLKMGTSNVTLYAIYKKIVTIPTNALCTNPTYNGSSQQLTSVTSGDGYTLSGYSGTDAGSYTVTASLSGFFRWSDGTTGNKTFTCSIGKKAVTVTASSGSKTYDGSALSNTTGCSITAGSVLTGHTVTCSNSGSITNKGSVANTLNSVVVKSGTTDVSGNYAITKRNGTLTVNARSITVTAGGGSKTYDGSALTNASGCSVTSGSVVSGHTVTCSNSGSITNKGSATNTLSSVVIKSGTTEVSSNYSITKANGTLTINARATTCTSGSSSRAYNGSALTNTTGGSCTNLVSGHSATFSGHKGTITNVGSVANTFGSVAIKNSGGADISGNYTIATANGTLTVTRAKTATTGSCINPTYNGSGQALASGARNASYSNNSRTESGSQTVTVTAGSNYAFSDGQTSKTLSCSIGKRATTCTSGSSSRAYNGSALTNTTGGSCTNLVSGHSATFSGHKGTITNVGSVANTFGSVAIKNSGGADISGNYTIATANGTLTVTRAKTATTGSCINPTYNGSGQALASGARNASYSNNSRTESGSQTVTVTAGSNYAFSDGQTSKTLSCSIGKRATTCTSGSSSRGYNGSALTNTTGGSCTNLVSGHSATFSGHKGTITNVGSVANTFGSVVIKSGTTDVSGNYSITKANGTLTVNKVNATCPTTTAYSGNFNNAGHSIGVSGGSGGTIQYSTDNSNWSTTNPSRTVSGSQTTYVRVVGDSNHNTITCTARTITINAVTVTTTFNPNGATLTAQSQSNPSSCSTTTTSGVVKCSCSIGNSSGCVVTSPAITAPSNSPTVVGFGSSTDSHSNSWSQKSQKTIYYNTGDHSYYAQTKHEASYKGSFNGTSEPGVSSISTPNEVTCSVTTTWNNATPATSCPIKSPTITPTTGNNVNGSPAGWYNKFGTRITGSGGTITLSSDQEFTARANITASGVTYTDTYSMGCSTVQCAIDKISTFLK